MFCRTVAATPLPSLISPRRTCSVPTYSWLNRWASWLASCITLRARSVKRSYMRSTPIRRWSPLRAVPHPAPTSILRNSESISQRSCQRLGGSLRLSGKTTHKSIPSERSSRRHGRKHPADDRMHLRISGRQGVFSEALGKPGRRSGMGSGSVFQSSLVPAGVCWNSRRRFAPCFDARHGRRGRLVRSNVRDTELRGRVASRFVPRQDVPDPPPRSCPDVPDRSVVAARKAARSRSGAVAGPLALPDSETRE